MNSLNALAQSNPWFLLLVLLWVLPWKGVALWRAARNEEKWWFVALLVINTFALLPILYIFYFSKRVKASKRAKKKDS